MTGVRLDGTELLLGGFVGVLRQVSALGHGRQDRYGAEAGDPWSMHIEGACAEMAVAKYLGRYWQPLAERGYLSLVPADIGRSIQVRSTDRPGGCLIIHPDDEDEHLFYLVIRLGAPRYTIAGWLRGRAGKRPEFWREDRGVRHPAFFVPQSALGQCAGGAEAFLA
jgi:hypothetical protein